MKEREFKTAFSLKIGGRSFVLLVQQDSNDEWAEVGVLDADKKIYISRMCYKGRMLFQDQKEVDKVHKKVGKIEKRHRENKIDADQIELLVKIMKIIRNV